MRLRDKLKVVDFEVLVPGSKSVAEERLRDHHRMAERVPEAVIQEDPALLMYYDNALVGKGE